MGNQALGKLEKILGYIIICSLSAIFVFFLALLNEKEVDFIGKIILISFLVCLFSTVLMTILKIYQAIKNREKRG